MVHGWSSACFLLKGSNVGGARRRRSDAPDIHHPGEILHVNQQYADSCDEIFASVASVARARAELSPVAGSAAGEALCLLLPQHSAVVDWTGRQWREGKASIHASRPPALAALGIDSDDWLKQVRGVGSGYWRAAGRAEALVECAEPVAVTNRRVRDPPYELTGIRVGYFSSISTISIVSSPALLSARLRPGD
jgi:hypothetical protein